MTCIKVTAIVTVTSLFATFVTSANLMIPMKNFEPEKVGFSFFSDLSEVLWVRLNVDSD